MGEEIKLYCSTGFPSHFGSLRGVCQILPFPQKVNNISS